MLKLHSLQLDIKEFVNFIGVGVINTFLTYFIYLGLLMIAHYHLAYFISYVIGIAISYILNLKYVFKKKSSINKIFKFPLVYVAQYFIGAVLMEVLINKLDINQVFAPIVVIVITLPITFFLAKKVLQ